MFRLFRKNYLYSKSIDPHCAYCAHCTKDNEHQGVCDLRGIVALAGHCKKFVYNPLMRVPPKPARIRGRFTDEDFFFEERIEPEHSEDFSEECEDVLPASRSAAEEERSAAPVSSVTDPDSSKEEEEL